MQHVVVADHSDQVRAGVPIGLQIPLILSTHTAPASLVVFVLQLPVSTIRQRSAFPPNYVHSLDSTHMLLTASKCKEKGLAFAAVHDSYWTHAGDISQMNHVRLTDRFPQIEPSLMTLHP
jgi:DNA-directed RNA polymerase